MKNKRFNIEVDLKPRLKEFGYFSKKRNKYVIEVNTERAQLVEIQTLFHEFCHFVCTIQDKLIEASLTKVKDPKVIYVKKEQQNEEGLCERISRLATKEFKKYLTGG
jgi:hypothetical protein